MFQHPVAGFMAMGIVKPLEVVDIDDRYAAGTVMQQALLDQAGPSLKK